MVMFRFALQACTKSIVRVLDRPLQELMYVKDMNAVSRTGRQHDTWITIACVASVFKNFGRAGNGASKIFFKNPYYAGYVKGPSFLFIPITEQDYF